MPELQRLRTDHAQAVLAFELANRAYFASFISDRGNEFYDHFAEHYNVTLAEQEAGTCIFHVSWTRMARCSAGSTSTVLARHAGKMHMACYSAVLWLPVTGRESF